MEYEGGAHQPRNRGIQAGCTNESMMESTATDTLDPPRLPDAAHKIKMWSPGNTILLKGNRDPLRCLYMLIPLHKPNLQCGSPFTAAAASTYETLSLKASLSEGCLCAEYLRWNLCKKSFLLIPNLLCFRNLERALGRSGVACAARMLEDSKTDTTNSTSISSNAIQDTKERSDNNIKKFIAAYVKEQTLRQMKFPIRTEQAFALFFLYNDYELWLNITNGTRIRKKFTGSKSGINEGWREEGQDLYGYDDEDYKYYLATRDKL
eukprot:jgi/Psemu1/40013/gm1.40013_g